MSTKKTPLEKESQPSCLDAIMFSLPDIRNKLSPIKNLITMLENGLVKGTIEVHPLITAEINECKKSIAYLSGKCSTNN